MSYEVRILAGVSDSPAATQFVKHAFRSTTCELELTLKYGRANTEDIVKGVRLFDKEFLAKNNPVKRSLVLLNTATGKIGIERVGQLLYVSSDQAELIKNSYADTISGCIEELRRNIDSTVGHAVISQFSILTTEFPSVIHPENGFETDSLLDTFFGSDTEIIITRIKLNV